MKSGSIKLGGMTIGSVEETIRINDIEASLEPIDISPLDDSNYYNPSGRAFGSDTGKGFHHHGVGHSRPSHEPSHKNQHHFPGHQHHPAAGRHHHPTHDQDQHRHTTGDVGDIPYSSAGNPFDRTRIASELSEKPWLREKIKHIMLGENTDPRANAAVFETMANRAIVRGTSLEEQAKRHASSGVDEHGYYAGYASHYNAEQGEMADRNIDAALRGSNITGYATDNSSGALAAREAASGAFIHHKTINGESFFSPGSAEPALRDRWQTLNRRAQEFEANKKEAAKIDPMTQPM